MGIDAGRRDLGCNVGHVGRPGQSRRRSVLTVVVVLIKDGLRVAVRGCGAR
jgi:hypothetical protein